MLKLNKFAHFTGNAVKPLGWLRRQLEIQADGLSGHLDKIWPDVSHSRWIGGDKEGWERVPYWLDGFIPLAWLLDDEKLKTRAKRYVDAILAQQQEDGWICPCSLEERRGYDIWALFLICKVLALYADMSGDERVQPALYRALKQFDTHIDKNTLFNWGAARWFECLIPLFWLYERQPEEWMINLAHKLRVEGIDYNELFNNYKDQIPQKRWTYLTHVVNLAMCLKQGALYSRLTKQDPDQFARRALDTLLAHHSMAVGHFTGDECVAGDSPIRGSELCGVVEAMYSYEVLLCTGGNPVWADQLEKLAFNALPATLTPDMWAHQYDQLSNQVQCAPMEPEHKIFGTNGPESHVFGLEPNFGCCTANFSQGFPKFAMTTFLRSEHGLVSAVLAPSEVRTEINGAKVSCRLETDYPFRSQLRYTLLVDQPATFSLSIRIPGFATRAFVDGQPIQVGAFHTISQEWRGSTQVLVELEFSPKLKARPRGMACLWHGPLLYALPIDSKTEVVEYEKNGVIRKFPYCDYYFYPTSAWNYGFADRKFEVVHEQMGEYPFSMEGAAISIAANLSPVNWQMEHGVCTEEPLSSQPSGPAKQLRMVPYGCTNLRMTEMPLLF